MLNIIHSPSETLSKILHNLKIQNLRCFSRLEVEWRAGRNYILGRNAEGKTSLLEAIAVLATLQSPRVSSLKEVIAHGEKGFAVQGRCGPRLLQVYYGVKRRKLALDNVEQKKARDYLGHAAAVFLGNADLALVGGSPGERRRFLDFLGTQMFPEYRERLRTYQKTLSRRNRLLKTYPVPWPQVEAYTAPLLRAGLWLSDARQDLVARLQPFAREKQQMVSAGREPPLELAYEKSAGEDFAETLVQAREEESRFGQTAAGPHRDDLLLRYEGGPPLAGFASEGQQRTTVLALKMAQFALLREEHGEPPLLLIDDVFGELDAQRRNALLQDLPDDVQVFITTTSLDWMTSPPREKDGLYRIEDHEISPTSP